MRIGLSLAIHPGAMAHREFRDPTGRRWDVWSVIPERAERRRQTAALPSTAERRRQADSEYRVPLGEQWTRGWLAFETRGEKRRLAPIPDGWEQASDAELDAMRERATPIARPPRRLAE